MTSSERDFAREIAAAAVMPLEGIPLAFGAALEMATTNVAARIRPLLDAASSAATAKERERAAKIAESAYPCSCDEAYKSRGLTAPEEELAAKLTVADDVEWQRRHDARMYPKEVTTTPWVGFHPDEVRRWVAEIRRLRALGRRVVCEVNDGDWFDYEQGLCFWCNAPQGTVGAPHKPDCAYALLEAEVGP